MSPAGALSQTARRVPTDTRTVRIEVDIGSGLERGVAGAGGPGGGRGAGRGIRPRGQRVGRRAGAGGRREEGAGRQKGRAPGFSCYDLPSPCLPCARSPGPTAGLGRRPLRPAEGGRLRKEGAGESPEMQDSSDSWGRSRGDLLGGAAPLWTGSVLRRLPLGNTPE